MLSFHFVRAGIININVPLIAELYLSFSNEVHFIGFLPLLEQYIVHLQIFLIKHNSHLGRKILKLVLCDNILLDEVSLLAFF